MTPAICWLRSMGRSDMPVLDGIETIGAVGGTSGRCPFILITGRLPLYTSTARELAQANGIEIVDVLQKPVSLARLRAALKHVPPVSSR